MKFKIYTQSWCVYCLTKEFFLHYASKDHVNLRPPSDRTYNSAVPNIIIYLSSCFVELTVAIVKNCPDRIGFQYNIDMVWLIHFLMVPYESLVEKRCNR